MGIFDKKRNRDKQFQKATEGKGKKEIRKAEEGLLKPEILTDYAGPTPKHKSELASRTALIVFRNKAQKDLIGEVFSIRTSVNGETYITDISLLEYLATMVKDGAACIHDGKLVFNTEIPDGEQKDPNAVYSMKEYQEKYFPNDVGKICPECGEPYKEKESVWPTVVDNSGVVEDNTPMGRKRRKL